MRGHRRESTVQAAGCDALATLSCINNEFTVKIASFGGIEAILAAMNGHGSDSDVQAAGCRALLNLACSNLENRIKIVELGGNETIKVAMRGLSLDSPLWNVACAALQNLADHADLKDGSNRTNFNLPNLSALSVRTIFSEQPAEAFTSSVMEARTVLSIVVFEILGLAVLLSFCRPSCSDLPEALLPNAAVI